MQQRKLGANGPQISAIGLGCMGMSDFYSTAQDEKESIATLHRALELGVTLLDTADMYGPHTNELLLGKAIKGKREQVFLATKFGIVRDPANPHARGICGKPDYIRRAVEGSLTRLGTDVIDLYYQHRIDPTVPIEETVGTLAELVQEGKIRYIGLSEASATTLERAHRVHPITALQSEYSLWTRDMEAEILPTCERLGIGFVPYSPLGRGFLTGAIRSPDDLAADDFRRTNPRFSGENFGKNLQLVEKINQLAQEKQVTPSQLALAWVLAQGEHIVPIPGTKRRRYLEENVAALDVTLTKKELAAIDAIFPPDAAAGERYGKESMAALNQ
ncbi:aldo/keto reductase [Pectobacterium odoriferum]|uniref:Aldo/keto reductase n=1 Tax=Pectobacterium odoriferum TaxID=78398 RepID=A0ABR4VTT3_9GAMM|nr:aldo/keto reductase [Pectobacterium odoriferum]KGA42704.1 aldo/keto reductase [Pectobacterium odoriferum]MCA6962029.1 aldo/keto reductase [Pectobacterium odoriferum]MCH5010128.1 aldo/keto reductase [Pectobacterium odoriferum]